MAKGLDNKFLHYGIRKEDLDLIETLCEKHNVSFDWFCEEILRKFQSQVVGNPDTDAATRRFEQIIDEVMARQRSRDLSLYREYRDSGFRRDFINLIRTAIENGDRSSNVLYRRGNQ